MRRFEVICGGVLPAKAHDEETTIRLDVDGPGKNVNRPITDLPSAMVSDVLLDLFDVAAYVHCADQRMPRGSDKLTDYGRDWRRDIHFTIPLRQPERWLDPAVRDVLVETLNFLSDDTYTFTFKRADEAIAFKQPYFRELIDARDLPHEVAMFSGGIDSLAGAVHDLVENGKSLLLVGHRSSEKVYKVQRTLVDHLRWRGFSERFFYAPVTVTNSGDRAVEFTQRPRSFLFAFLGLIVAQMIHKDSFTFYENGVVAINLPIAGDVLGGRATRTMHPKVLRGFEELFSALLERTIKIRTPFQWLTKKDVLKKLERCGAADLLPMTSSCTRPRKWTNTKRHCGACFQCIDRRFNVLAAGMEGQDPQEHYQLDLMTDDRSVDNAHRMTLAYVNFSRKLLSTTKSSFLRDHPEATVALKHFPGLTTEEARDRVFDLLQRHAADVLEVVAEGARRHGKGLAWGELPAASLLPMCFGRGKIEIAPPSGYDRDLKDFMDRLASPICDFAVDAKSRRIFFKGGFDLTGKYFDLVEALLENFRTGKATGYDISYVLTSDLALALNVGEASLRQIVTRVRKLVAERLAVDLGLVLGKEDFIENKERQGYRLAPTLREVSLTDLQRNVAS